MIIEEKHIKGKRNQEECEDGIEVNDRHAVVIDGSTSKSATRVRADISNGQYCMELVREYASTMPEDIDADAFGLGVTAYVRSRYEAHGVDVRRLSLNPTERMTASAVVYSAFHRQVWMFGDCQCIVNGRLYENPKPQEEALALKRASYLRAALRDGLRAEDVEVKDPGREFIIEELKVSCLGQNVEYAVIDGFPIPMDKVRIINLDPECREIVLATDGYTSLRPTLAESEEALAEQLRRDPLCIDTYKATKGLMRGNLSFDDRAYLRIRI